MEDQTQAVLGDEEDDQGDQEESDINPVGYLRVLSQKDLEQTDYPIQEGEVTLGRGSDCDLVIEARSLSRKHATVLVEGGTHFVQDLDSRNKTYRRTVQLRPNAFYELTHGCELTFADIKCVYYVGSLPEEEEEEEEEEEGEAATNEEATQAYSVGEEEGGGEGGEDEGDSDEIDDDDVNAEPTQAYHFDGAAAEGEEEEEGEVPMDCDPTVAYHVEAAEDDDDEDSPPSSPILVTTKQLLPKEDASKTESSSPSGAKKSSKSKNVCFATGTAPGSVEGEASTSRASTPKKKEKEEGEEEEGGGDETDGEETDGEEESTQPHKEGKESKAEGMGEGSKSDGGGGMGSTTTPASKEPEAGAVSAMDVDEGDPTVAYELETDEENTETEDLVRGGSKEERKTEGKEKVEGEGAAGGGAEPTVPYNLKEEEEEDDSDKTDVEQEESETVPEASKVADKLEAEAVSGSSKKEAAAATKAATAGEQRSEETDNGGGDTENAESSATEPESQEVKEKPAHLRPPPRVARNAKTISAVSLMDCTEQGQRGGDGSDATVQLDSYESTCDETVPLHPSPSAPAVASAIDKEATATMATVAMETLPLSPSTAAKEEEEKKEEEGESKEEPQPPAGAQLEEVKKEEESDSSDSLIPELSGLGSKGISKRSKQKTLFDVVSSQRGRGRGGRRGGRRGGGRKATVTRKAGTRIDEPSGEGDTEEKKPVESKSDVRTETAEPTLDLKTEEDADKKSKVTTDGDATISKLKTLDSIGGISGKVANLRLKTLSLIVPDTASSGEIVNDGGASATIAHDSKNEIAASSEGVKVKEQGSKRGRGRGRRRTTSRQTSSKTITEATSTAAIAANTVDLPEEEESPDLPFLSKSEDDTNDQSDHSISTTSTASLESSHSGRGRKGKGRGGASKRRRAAATPRRKSTETTPKARTPSSTPSLRQHRTPSSASRVVSKSPSSTPGEKPRIMFTGLIDKNGERTIRELGGELVDSVYQCTHLITDKVRRTVKFLCCLSRGCLIVSDAWLDQCAAERRFLLAEPYLIKDKPAERQHKFTLQRSHESAKVTKLLAGYKVYLTPNVKPEREQMSDIIKCSGGEVFDFGASSFSPGPGGGGGEKVVVIACEEDLALCKDAMESGVPVHSTELILGGVLRQELELHDHLMTAPASTSVAGRKRRAKESSIVPAAKRKRK